MFRKNLTLKISNTLLSTDVWEEKAEILVLNVSLMGDEVGVMLITLIIWMNFLNLKQALLDLNQALLDPNQILIATTTKMNGCTLLAHQVLLNMEMFPGKLVCLLMVQDAVEHLFL